MKNSRGQCLILFLLVMSVTSWLAMSACFPLLKSAYKRGHAADADVEFRSLILRLRTAWDGGTLCSSSLLNAESPATLAKFNPDVQIPTTQQLASVGINGLVLAATDKVFPSFHISSVTLAEVSPPVRTVISATKTKYLATLTIRAEKSGYARASPVYTHDFPLWITASSTGVIESCKEAE